jgi:ribosomal protein L37E
VIKKCKNCGREKEHEARGLCYSCYRKIFWKPKIIVCKRCKKEMPHHSKGLCAGCYNFVFFLDKNKAWNQKKNFGLDLETYKSLTKECFICGFDKVVDLHHLDENKKNNMKSNLIGLCPNHHKMLHDFRFRKEIRKALSEKGITLFKDEKLDFNFH